MLKPCIVYATGFFSFVFLVVGISLALTNVFPGLVQSEAKREVVLRNGTVAFDAWENPPAPIYMQFYFFNLTNPLEVLDGDRPAVVEIGPYTYREYRPMEEVSFDANGTTVAAVNTKTYIFQANMSRGLQTDLIRTVNIPAMTVMERFKDHPSLARLISDFMRDKEEGLFTTRTVGQLLWGYLDPLLQAVHVFQPDVDPVFGLFSKSNASSDGRYVFFTGQQNYKDFARVDTWNNESSLKWWTSEECNMINGTNGASFHPVITKQERLYMFSSDLCRSIYAVFEEDVAVKGIPAYRFSPPSQVFANHTVNPANAGFCVPASNCLGSGVLNVSPCKQGAPIIMSSPHFYQGDPKFVQGVFGMKPNKDDHQTLIDVHPLTGTILQAAKRLQINVYVQQIPTFTQTGNVSTVIFPVLHLNESVVIDDVSVKKVAAAVFQQNLVLNIPFMLIGVAILLGGVFMLLVCRQKIPESTAAERQPLLAS
ncbi:lysosome membrane protein 2c [Nerophis lumbriciformis]|uniref:lysosome membrane protein 2c n=1 Tax=Nerophis lumbriciformis TaxID=546530 RepID=UPI002ADFCCB3|nr:lysosome membrane protein 2c [Nerophis lumbriciformis]